jgi:hypothetical protein
VAVVTRPLWFMTVLDRTVLGGQPRGTLDVTRVLQAAGERGDPQPGQSAPRGGRSFCDSSFRLCSESGGGKCLVWC